MKRRNASHQQEPRGRARYYWWALGVCVAAVVLAASAWQAANSPAESAEAPEADAVLRVQEHMPFQVLIPAYLPRDFDRTAATITIDEVGPGGEPMVQLVYRTRRGATLFVREWMPFNPALEILAASRPIETKWGKGWLLAEGTDLVAIWVDVGPLRASLYTYDLDVISREQLLAAADSLGPASNRQVFSIMVEAPTIKEVAPPAPEQIAVDEHGVQALTLVVTPGGYAPMRFAVRKDIPVRLTFRQLGQVGCGNVLIFPADPQHPSALTLASDQDQQVLEFTPRAAGEFEFYCSHHMYRGVMTVLP